MTRKIKWTKEAVLIEAKKYQSRSEFSGGSRGAYKRASAMGWLDSACDHMQRINRPNGYWTLDKIQEAANSFNYRNEFRLGNCAAYSAALKYNKLDEVCLHMKRKSNPSGFWTDLRIREEAKKYKWRSEFFTQSPAAYNRAREKGILDSACLHMTRRVKKNIQLEAAK